jgi:phosphonoacetaldehyde hydrolase
MESIPTKTKRALKAIVLDWAGTTVDFGCMAPVAGFQTVLQRRGIRVDAKQVRQFMGRAKRDHIRAILELDEVARQWTTIHGRLPQASDVELLYTDFIEVQQDFIRDGAQLIPGCLEAIEECRNRGLKIGSSTGYFQEQMDTLVPLAAQQGYRPDAIVCANNVPAGRPAPWEVIENAKLLDVYPMNAIVKVDDTVVGIEAGRNAGAWTIGIYETGNLVGLRERELRSLPVIEQRQLFESGKDTLCRAGAHATIASIAGLPTALDQIEQRIAKGETP